MRRSNVLFLTIMLAGAANCFATLIPISSVGTNLVPTSGAGFGAVSTLLNADNSSGTNTDGLESNCNLFTNSVVTQDCGGPFISLGLTIHDAGNQNHAQSIASTGITNSSTAAQQLLLVFNTNQTGPHTAAGESITLDALGFALWYNGNVIFSAVRSTHDTYDTTLQGVGQAGFGYKLDDAQAATAQAIINDYIAHHGATLNTIFATGAFQAGCLSPATTSCANDGPETIFLDSQAAVPEPMSLSLVGAGLLALGLFRKRFSA